MSALFFWASLFLGRLISIVPNTAVALIFLVGAYAIRRAALINQGLIFTGVAYLLVYIGAIAILFLFVIILVDTQNLQIETAFESRIPAFGLGLLRYLLCTLPGSNYLNVQNSHIVGWENLHILGCSLYAEQRQNLILTGLVLILALVGAVYLSRSH